MPKLKKRAGEKGEDWATKKKFVGYVKLWNETEERMMAHSRHGAEGNYGGLSFLCFLK